MSDIKMKAIQELQLDKELGKCSTASLTDLIMLKLHRMTRLAEVGRDPGVHLSSRDTLSRVHSPTSWHLLKLPKKSLWKHLAGFIFYSLWLTGGFKEKVIFH